MIKVMLVDSNSFEKAALYSYLSQKPDITVTGQASDGEEAERMLMQSVPDVLLLDLVMPKLDGMDLLLSLHSQARYHRMRVIMMSSMMEDHVIRRAINAGAVYCLAKPVLPERLYDRIVDIGTDDTLIRTAPLVKMPTASGAITDALLRECVSASLDGYPYLRDSIMMTRQERRSLAITKDIYPELARRYGKTPRCIERAMRTAIKSAESSQAFGSTGVFMAGSHYTNSEFINRIAQSLS